MSGYQEFPHIPEDEFSLMKQRLLDTYLTPDEQTTSNATDILIARMALAIENRDQTIDRLSHDTLTGLETRALWNDIKHEWAENLVTQLRRPNKIELHQAVLLLIDFDYFKWFNESWDHQIGDNVLMAGGVAMKRLIRKSDRICRYGGDELAGILPIDYTEETITSRAIEGGKIFHTLLTAMGIKDRYSLAFLPFGWSVGLSTILSKPEQRDLLRSTINEQHEKRISVAEQIVQESAQEADLGAKSAKPKKQDILKNNINTVITTFTKILNDYPETKVKMSPLIEEINESFDKGGEEDIATLIPKIEKLVAFLEYIVDPKDCMTEKVNEKTLQEIESYKRLYPDFATYLDSVLNIREEKQKVYKEQILKRLHEDHHYKTLFATIRPGSQIQMQMEQIISRLKNECLQDMVDNSENIRIVMNIDSYIHGEVINDENNDEQ